MRERTEGWLCARSPNLYRGKQNRDYVLLFTAHLQLIFIFLFLPYLSTNGLEEVKFQSCIYCETLFAMANVGETYF